MKSAPRLVTRALLASFTTVAVVLLAVFVLISVDVQQRVRATVAANLDDGQRVAARVEERRRRDMLAMASTLAENPTLKAALDTWQAERALRRSNEAALIETVQREANKIAARVVDADVLALLDVNGNVVASAGRHAPAWTKGMPLRVRGPDDRAEFVARVPAGLFRVIGVPLNLGDAMIGSLELGHAIDGTFAKDLADLVHGHSAVIVDGRTIVTTLSAAAAWDLAAFLARGGRSSSLVTLDGESYALRHVYDVDPARFYTLASIDGPARTATAAALMSISTIGAIALALAAIGSFWLAHILANPIDQLSRSVTAMTNARIFDSSLAATGSSHELDTLTRSFNELIRAVAAAEAQTQAAYLGAIRALAAALDARDPYTAGHSERVSALSVAIGKAMSLGDADIEILRLGALLHDIGKIGVTDEVLRKPSALTPAEFDLIRAHPVVGARILRSIPFLASHLPIVELHHERHDGRGYPHGLIGEEIPLAARIVHVADAYDAMTSARAYRPARLPQEAVAELRRCAGTDFDPQCVEALVRAVPAGPTVPADREPAAAQFAGPIKRYAS